MKKAFNFAMKFDCSLKEKRVVIHNRLKANEYFHSAIPKTAQRNRTYLILRLLCTSEQTSSPGSNETGFLALGCVTRDSRGFTDMLVVTTTVRLVKHTLGTAKFTPYRNRNLHGQRGSWQHRES